MASSINLRQLDLNSDVSEGSRVTPIEHLADRKAANSNAARRLCVGASELATRHNLEAARLSWSGMRV